MKTGSQKFLIKFYSEVALGLILISLQSSFAMQDKGKRFPEEITYKIVKQTAIEQSLINVSPINLALVCNKWSAVIKSEFKSGQDGWKAWHGVPGNEEIYEKFLKGVLIYRPDGKSDDGRIDLPIASLVNPLEGTFDLSRCGDAGKYLSISTGYRKGKKPENANKVEIWFTPRFLVEKKLQGTASHSTGYRKGKKWENANKVKRWLTPRFLVEKELQGTASRFNGIFPANWQNDAPVGIIWNGGGLEDLSDSFDYLTDQSMAELSNNNLYEKWRTSVVISDVCDHGRFISQCPSDYGHSDHFHISFVN